MKRITQLDGLRALAVLAVVLHHRGLLAASGWVGVDVFFVLSGFLITGILLNSAAEPHPFRHFYQRRVQRILPSYLLCLALVCAFAWSQWHSVVAWYVLFAGNIEVALHPASRLGPWGAYWSLAIEEHFYLLWPLLVLRCTRRTLTRILIAILVLSPILRAIALHFLQDPLPVYYLTPFRLDGLAIGALLALARPTWTQRLRPYSIPIAALLPATMILLTILRCRFAPWFMTIGFSAIALGSAGLVFVLLEDQIPALTRLLQTRLLRAIGIVSFTFYLIEEPIAHATQSLAERYHYHHGQQLRLAMILAGLAYATLSWHLLEKPILSLGRSSPTPEPVKQTSP